jgi:UDP-N-acetylglucosamine 2-epimerase
MYDAILQFSMIANDRSTVLKRLDLKLKEYLLATIHRPYNTEDPNVLNSIIFAFGQANETIIFPIHPRTLKTIKIAKIAIPPNVKIIDPVGYLDMLVLEQNARVILTDSGGIQKEAYFFNVQCLTLRPETEWVETIESGWNKLVGIDPKNILSGLKIHLSPQLTHPDYFGDGHASERIVELLRS